MINFPTNHTLYFSGKIEVDFDDLVKGMMEILENQPKQHKYHELQTEFDI